MSRNQREGRFCGCCQGRAVRSHHFVVVNAPAAAIETRAKTLLFARHPAPKRIPWYVQGRMAAIGARLAVR